MEPFSINDFSSNPSVHYLRNHRMRKDDWLAIAVNHDISVRKVWRNSQIKNFVINALVEGETLPEEAYDLLDEEGSQLALKQLELQYARGKEERDRHERREREELEKKERREREERERERDELERKDRIEREEREHRYQLELLEKKRTIKDNVSQGDESEQVIDVVKASKMIQLFDEADPDEFFMLFERLALNLKWPKRLWPVILQQSLKGKARTVFLSLTSSESNDYDFTKDSILKAYELTAEYYRLKFRRYKFDSHSYIEYSHNLVKLHDKWYTAASVTTLSEYRELILLEQFIRGVPIDVQRYLFELGVVDELPIRGVDFLMGNDLAGGKVVPSPIVVDTPLERSRSLAVVEVPRERGTDVTKDVNVSTMSGTLGKDAVGTVDVDININSLFQTDSFGGNVKEKESVLETKFGLKTGNVLVNTVNSIENEINSSNVFDYSDNLFDMKCSDIIKAQQEDLSLQSIYSEVVAEDQINTEPVCYYLRNGLLMRKFRSLHTPASSIWEIKNQIVIPVSLRAKVLHMAHNVSSSHLGIRKTLSAVLQLFYWPGIRKSVTEYCKSCSVCQLVGKPNQIIKPAPLQPIPVLSEPFDKVILDCVGPLPKSKKQDQYMITMMCSSIRYPDAYPLRNISSKTLIPVLIKFFTQYGIPKIAQTDRGSNFTSDLFRQVMAAMSIKHILSSVYHPESQGALERFHQTLKDALTNRVVIWKESERSFGDTL
ncbi:uncharacterized protein [Palaemon carinicauda]|uniref:uncharacterized protein n=1 Tax=Palaemon carinicauda TaxID=392227 RepID=UPI0035B58204